MNDFCKKIKLSKNQISLIKNKKLSNLGMNLEKDINSTNLYYNRQNKALIFKSEIPIQVVKVKYHQRKKTQITEAYYRSRSLPDYQGLYKEKYLCFDAKETNHKTNFTFANIPEHQILHLQRVKQFKGIAFFLIFFVNKNKYFYMPIEFFINYINNTQKKSINYNILEKELFEIPFGYSPRIDYLKIVDKFLK
ncbi:Holliday junction resolvase RecU [Candidatus Phytoplasma pini]|uniref:Holliday junction resolvase RecU n=1 Tax=Candidatus Phytoplasma pini TaxID=267362 RepID=A0A559KJF3_9MOLU|nr:Holliday junction resolvase RecU [Candidatus Phytoplasma pini]TVY12262.1 Holliday junction-specific endonuclease [Candidatus Phytoplasma pini]